MSSPAPPSAPAEAGDDAAAGQSPLAVIASAEETSWISWLKFAAIVGVVGIHTSGVIAGAKNARESNVGLFALFLDLLAICAVPVFVMVSGALVLDPKRFHGTSDFLRRRAIRLIPAIIFWNAFYLCFALTFEGKDVTSADALKLLFTGKLQVQLYYLWIALGLALMAPIFIKWIGRSSPAEVLGYGAALAMLPILTMVTMRLRGASIAWIETPWTWWFFYLGLFILGWRLRGVRVPTWMVIPTIGIGLTIAWQFRNPTVPALINTLFPVSYYGPVVIGYSLLVFLTAHSLLRPDGILGFTSRGRLRQVGRSLGDATLGVFGIHIAVLLVLREFWPAKDLGIAGLLAQIAIVVAVSYAIVLPLRRVPIINRVL